MIEHGLLIDKLRVHSYFSRNACRLISSYLCHRRQAVVVNNNVSNYLPIEYGVPQCSILGPLLFILFINDLPRDVGHGSVLLYADDCTFIFTAKDIDVLETRVNHVVASFSRYCGQNRLVINTSNSKCMFFNIPNASVFNILLDDTALERVSSFILLGTRFDDKLRFDVQVSYVIGKLKSVEYMLRKYGTVLPNYALHRLFDILGRSHLFYNNVSYYAFLNKTQCNLLNQQISRCTKVILAGTTQQDLPFQSMSHTIASSFVNRLITAGDCCKLLEVFQEAEHRHDTRHRTFQRYRPRGRIGEGSFNGWGPKLFSKNSDS